MVLSKDELEAVKALRGNASWDVLSTILLREKTDLTVKLVNSPPDVGQIAKLQGAIALLRDILNAVNP
jgi:hypothetical protein